MQNPSLNSVRTLHPLHRSWGVTATQPGRAKTSLMRLAAACLAASSFFIDCSAGVQKGEGEAGRT
jgi:hypothetical protein